MLSDLERASAVGDLARDPRTDPAGSLSAGSRNLLLRCLRARPGQRLLIVEEPREAGYYDDAAPRAAASAARTLGLKVYVTEAPLALASAAEGGAFIESLRGFDHVLFFARVGDQLRFSDLGDTPPVTMCYALDHKMLDGAFGAACHDGLDALRRAIDGAFEAATDVHVTCPRGTDFRGAAPMGAAAPVDVSLTRFPMLVPRPVPAERFDGVVTLSRFLVGTGSHFYEPYALFLDEDVQARLSGGRIVDLEGPGPTVEKVRRHYEMVAARFEIDPWAAHSWHAGIHPGCGFDADARSNLLRWSGSAFGNPRILHFHTCGDYAPGEISWNVIDPTVRLDGVALWEDGRLHPNRIPACATVLEAHPHLEALYREPRRDIGIWD